MSESALSEIGTLRLEIVTYHSPSEGDVCVRYGRLGCKPLSREKHPCARSSDEGEKDPGHHSDRLLEVNEKPHAESGQEPTNPLEHISDCIQAVREKGAHDRRPVATSLGDD